MPFQNPTRPDSAPIGAGALWFTSTPPDGWLICDGSAIDTSEYPELAALIGANLPDLRDRFPIGTSGTKAIGTAGGAATKTITAANLPPHSHTMNHGHDIHTHTSGGAGGTVVRGQAPATADIPNPVIDFTGSTGNGPGNSTALDVMNPWRSVHFIIKGKL